MYILITSENGSITTEQFDNSDLAVVALEAHCNDLLDSKKYTLVPNGTAGFKKVVSKDKKASISWKIEEIGLEGKGIGAYPEDKSEICKRLCKTLQATRFGSDLIDIRYSKKNDDEVVDLVFLGGVRKVNVSLDSGAAMIKDIVMNMGL